MLRLAHSSSFTQVTDVSSVQLSRVEVGLAADVGTLQRLPKIVGNDAIVRELAYTARKMPSQEALHLGLVASVQDDLAASLAHARTIAVTIASHSPLAILGTKVSLNFSRDRTVQEGLDHVRQMNSAYLQSPDVPTAMISQLKKQRATFAKL